MHIRVFIIISMLGGMLMFGQAVNAFSLSRASAQELLVQFKNGDRSGIALGPGEDMDERIRAYRDMDAVVIAQPNYRYTAEAVSPNDALYSRQQNYLEQIRVPEAWQQSTGSNEVVIAVIDSGVDMDHPDIIQNMWFNRGEKALNGIDDDNNGYVDDLNGWDFIDEVSDPHPKIRGDYDFTGVNHGTIVAGIAAGVANNRVGIAGICWQCKIMALRALDSFGEGSTESVARAIDYAIANNADIINMSFVGNSTDRILDDAIARAHQAGIAVIAAVGNDVMDASDTDVGNLDTHPIYPACNDGPSGRNYVIGVGSVDADNRKSVFSNFGTQCLDISAPGEGIVAPVLFDPAIGEEFTDMYRAGWQGTSVATPMVSGVAGLMMSVQPEISNDQLLNLIMESSVDISDTNRTYAGMLGAGVLDAAKAVARARDYAIENIPASSSSMQPAPPSRSESTFFVSPYAERVVDVTPVDVSGTAFSAFRGYPDFFRGGAEVVRADVNGDGVDELVLGAGSGGGPQVRIFTIEGRVLGQFFAYDASFRGGVHVAAADVDNNGADEIITSAGGGSSSQVRIFSANGSLRGSFEVNAEGLSGGITVAAADIDHDGAVEIITGTGGGSLPLVQIFDTVGQRKGSWLAYPEFFRGGVNVAAGDVDSDGESEVVTAAGIGGGPQVRIFDRSGKAEGQFFAFEKTFRGGAFIAVGNVDDDPAEEVIVGAGPGRASEVRIFNKFGFDYVQEYHLTVFEPEYTRGVRVGL